jgi:hypothetical protein
MVCLRWWRRRHKPARILEAKANPTRFRKQIDIRTFAYLV